MYRPANAAEAANRARWLAELAVAIDEAQRVAWELGVVQPQSTEAKELYGQLECLRSEVESLRRDGWATRREEIEPPWINLASWGSEFEASR